MTGTPLSAYQQGIRRVSYQLGLPLERLPVGDPLEKLSVDWTRPAYVRDEFLEIDLQRGGLFGAIRGAANVYRDMTTNFLGREKARFDVDLSSGKLKSMELGSWSIFQRCTASVTWSGVLRSVVTLRIYLWKGQSGMTTATELYAWAAMSAYDQLGEGQSLADAKDFALADTYPGLAEEPFWRSDNHDLISVGFNSDRYFTRERFRTAMEPIWFHLGEPTTF